MDFNLTEVQQDFMNLARDFGEKRLAPTIMERDHQGIYDDALIAELLSLGITGAYFEEKYGGAGDDGGDVLSYILAVEELAKYDAGVSITLAENMLGEEGKGFKIAMMTLDGGRIGVGAQALGIAEGAYNAALQYAKERTQFGKPIGKFQAISFMLADMKLKIETARLAVYQAAWKMAQPDVKSYSVDAAIAKKYASDVAMQVTTDAVQVFGGYGFTREYPAERYMRDAKITQIYEGTNQVQQMIISGAILR